MAEKGIDKNFVEKEDDYDKRKNPFEQEGEEETYNASEELNQGTQSLSSEPVQGPREPRPNLTEGERLAVTQPQSRDEELNRRNMNGPLNNLNGATEREVNRDLDEYYDDSAEFNSSMSLPPDLPRPNLTEGEQLAVTQPQSRDEESHRRNMNGQLNYFNRETEREDALEDDIDLNTIYLDTYAFTEDNEIRSAISNYNEILHGIVQNTEEFKEWYNEHQNQSVNDYIRSNPDVFETIEENSKILLRDAAQNMSSAVMSSESMSTLDWGVRRGDVLSQEKEIRNDQGEFVCTLKQTYNNQNIVINDSTITQSRAVSIPTEVQNGPLNIALVCNKVDGNPPKKEDAVYFSVSYDQDGKLDKVEIPPIERWSGSDENAVALVQSASGEFATLPITRGEYQKLCKELDINNGVDLSRGRSQEDFAEDSFGTVASSLQNRLSPQPRRDNSTVNHRDSSNFNNITYRDEERESNTREDNDNQNAIRTNTTDSLGESDNEFTKTTQSFLSTVGSAIVSVYNFVGDLFKDKKDTDTKESATNTDSDPENKHMSTSKGSIIDSEGRKTNHSPEDKEVDKIWEGLKDSILTNSKDKVTKFIEDHKEDINKIDGAKEELLKRINSLNSEHMEVKPGFVPIQTGLLDAREELSKLLNTISGRIKTHINEEIKVSDFKNGFKQSKGIETYNVNKNKKDNNIGR